MLSIQSMSIYVNRRPRGQFYRSIVQDWNYEICCLGEGTDNGWLQWLKVEFVEGEENTKAVMLPKPTAVVIKEEGHFYMSDRETPKNQPGLVLCFKKI
jgi:hypothetical protein